MLLDIRTYRCKPGTIKKHLELYEKMGKKPQSRNLGQPLLFADVKQVILMSILIFGFIKMPMIEKRRERKCG